MKTHAIYLAVILFLCATLYGTCSWGKVQQAEKERYKSNYVNAVRPASKTATEYTVKRGELKDLFPAVVRELDSLKYKLKRVKAVHALDFTYKVDTVLVPVLNPGSLETPSLFDGTVWSFTDKCVTAELTKPDSSDLLDFKASVEVPLKIITTLYKPKWLIFKPRQWNPKRWQDSTKVETPCGIEIKENVRFEVK